MQISVAYAEPSGQYWQKLDVPEGTTLREAIARSGVLVKFPEIDLDKQKVGIFGKVTALDAPVNEGDRVEIYRHITVDPKTVPRRSGVNDDE